MTQQQLNEKFLKDVTAYFLSGRVLNAKQASEIKKQFYTRSNQQVANV